MARLIEQVGETEVRMRAPAPRPILTVAEMIAESDARKANGSWVPACGGTETPFRARSGRTLLYCWQATTGRHAYLDCGTDMILSDEEAAACLELH